MSKTLVVCCDGTWNTPDQQGAPTNVTKMARAILPRAASGDLQVVWYDEGVGTGNVVDRVVGGAFGIGLGENVRQAYRFLALNWEPGDRILLFGFSRGAFTVRSLGGLVGLVGLLHKGDLDRMDDVWEHYRTKPEERSPRRLAGLERLAGRQPDVDLIGVWDTVGSLGIPGNLLGRLGRRRHEFHDVRLNPKTKRAYQALAIDERRGNFQPAIWDTSALALGQVVEQVWFAGAHSNVGGGYPDATLADQAFLWMIGKARPLLDFDEDYLARRVVALKAEEARGAVIDSRTGKWRFLGDYIRPIGRDPSESVHPSALVRRRQRERVARGTEPFTAYPYDAPNLEAYLERTSVGT